MLLVLIGVVLGQRESPWAARRAAGPVDRRGRGWDAVPMPTKLDLSKDRLGRWRERRRDRAARTGDTPEKLAERPVAVEGDVGDAAARASTGLVANGAAFNG